MSTVYQQSRVGEIYGATVTLTVIATVAVILRIYARKLSFACFWWDDWTLIVALVLYFGFTTCYWIQARDFGFGRHTIQAGGPVDPATVTGFNKVFLALQILYYSTSMALKTSLILLYYRLFGVVRGFRYVLAGAECVVMSYGLACVFVAIFECKPVSYFWNKTIISGTCINQIEFYRWNGVANLLVDLMILSLTFPMVWRLKIAFRQKVTLNGIFLLGTFVFVASIVRVTTFEQLNPEDITYTNVSPGIWTVTEQSLGITCACLPTLRPLFGRMLFGRTNDSGNTLSNGEGPDIQLSKLFENPAIRRSSRDESARGFARLYEENVPSSSITSYATTGIRNEEVAPKAILKSQLIEQHYDSIESV